MARWVVLLLVMAGCIGTSPDPPAPGGPGAPGTSGPGELRLERVWGDLEQPLLVTHDGVRTFVVEQCGRIQVADNGSLRPWLDVSSQVSCGGERGLLGLAFPADHADTGRFYIAYTDATGASVLERRIVEAGEPGAPGQVLLTVAQPASNHNGGHLAFGPDGMLYHGLGDGGAAGDPWGNAQNPATLLGSILRLDVSGDSYASPPDNPFVGDTLGRDEVWSYGWRNPWRFSFDNATGDMWVADVGQDCWEEVDHEPAGAGGRNYGWPRFEGDHPFAGPSGATCIERTVDVQGYAFPVAEVRNDDHCSITGGHVVRGGPPGLRDAYVFGDYCSGTIWTYRDEVAVLMETSLRISSFGLDAAGSLHVVDHQGSVHRFTA